jgi:hypothetical protein
VDKNVVFTIFQTGFWQQNHFAQSGEESGYYSRASSITTRSSLTSHHSMEQSYPQGYPKKNMEGKIS